MTSEGAEFIRQARLLLVRDEGNAVNAVHGVNAFRMLA